VLDHAETQIAPGLLLNQVSRQLRHRVVAVTDRTRLANLASTGAELVAETIRKLTDRPMLVTVTVTHAGETLAEGYAGTDDYPEQDPDVTR
jgi:hypothetical protein